MKTLRILFTLVIMLTTTLTFSQVVSDIKPSEDGKMGEFTEWKSVDVSFEDGTSAKVEYRIALITRKGIGCQYDVEVKNNSDIKLEVTIKSSYYDKLVKSQFGDKIEEKLKPGKSIVGRLITQGCKADKGEAKKEDYAQCLSCDFGVSLYVSK